MPRKVLAPKVGVKGAERRAKTLRWRKAPGQPSKGKPSKKGPPRGKK